MTWEAVARVFGRALAHGAERPHPYRVVWDLAPRCQDPIGVTLTAAPSEGVMTRTGRYVEINPPFSRPTLTVELLTRCRKCEPCRRRQAAQWRFRARAETMSGVRNWFGTMTLAPDWRYRLQVLASREADRRDDDYDSLEPQARFSLYAKHAGVLVTKWLKRVRKQSGVRFRYLLVVEQHKSGDPHFHVLVHEQSLNGSVRKAMLKAQWSHGFSDFKLIKDVRTADYVCKYIAKGMMARVRASFRYGKTTLSA